MSKRQTAIRMPGPNR